MTNIVCPQCGNIIGKGKRFCTSCGAQTPADLPQQPPRASTTNGRISSQSRQTPIRSDNTLALSSPTWRFHAINIGSSSTENVYLKKTYSLFLIAVISICVIGYYSFHFVPKQHWATLGMLDCVIWILCGWFGWRHPIIISFPTFTVITGLFLGALANHYTASGRAEVFMSAAFITVMAFAGLTFYVFVTRKDFYWLLGFLCAGFWILLGSFSVYKWTNLSLIGIGIDIFGIVVFTGWILFDTSRILNRRDSELTPPIAAFELFLDIIGFHSYILDLLDWRDWF